MASATPSFYAKKPRYLTRYCKKKCAEKINVSYTDLEKIRVFVFKATESEPVNNQRAMLVTYSKKFNQEGERAANLWLRDVTTADAEKPRVAEARNEVSQIASNSLVKRSQSPTEQKAERRAMVDGQVNEYLARKKRKFEAKLHTCPEPLSLESRKTISESAFLADLPKKGSISNDAAVCVRMYHQEWSDNYRLGLETGALGAKTAPPLAAGERLTDSLSKKAVRNILESGAYLSTCRGGYSTFLTLTFNTEARKRILDIAAIPQGKVKKYSYKIKAFNPSTGRYKTVKKHYQIRCIDGVPSEYVKTDGKLDVEKAENEKGYCNGIAASGAWSSVEFKPVSSIGLEVARFFDGAQKIYQRGWLPRFKEVETTKSKAANMVIYSKTKKKIKSALPMICPEYIDPLTPDGSAFDDTGEMIKFNPRKHCSSEFLNNIHGECEKAAPLDYMWVAEMPENSKGEKNPHVHVMMRWQVEKPVFLAWAERLEALWGHGFAKLERIKTPEAASNYLLKAVGYLTKGNSSDQGVISGNRYGISASARAPKWQCIGEFYADNFLAILGEMREKLHRKKMKICAQRIACTQLRSKEKGLVKKLKNINKKTPSEKRAAYIEKLKKRLHQGDEAIKETSEELAELPFVNDFAIGNMNETQADNFLSWAMRERFWNADVKTHRYNTWDELKANTLEAVKHSRQHWRGFGAILQTSEITWQWSEYQNQFYDDFNPEHPQDNIYIDENGVEWEQQWDFVA